MQARCQIPARRPPRHRFNHPALTHVKRAGKMPALRTGSDAPTNRRGLPRFCSSHRSNQPQCRARPPNQVTACLLHRNAGILPAPLNFAAIDAEITNRSRGQHPAAQARQQAADKLKPVLLNTPRISGNLFAAASSNSEARVFASTCAAWQHQLTVNSTAHRPPVDLGNIMLRYHFTMATKTTAATRTLTPQTQRYSEKSGRI